MPETTTTTALLCRPHGHACPTCKMPVGTACETPAGRPRAPHATRQARADAVVAELARIEAWNRSCAAPGRFG